MIDLDTFMPLLQILALVAGVVLIAVMSRGQGVADKSRSVDDETHPYWGADYDPYLDFSYGASQGNIGHFESSSDD